MTTVEAPPRWHEMPLRIGRVVAFVVGTAGATAATPRSVGVRVGRGGDRPGPPGPGVADVAAAAALLLDVYDVAYRPARGDRSRLDLLQREWLLRIRSGDEARIDAVRRTAHTWYPVEEAERLLAEALELDDLRLTAEALWLWPVLGLPWRTTAPDAMRALDLQFFARGHVPLTGSGGQPLPDEGPEAGDRPGSRRATMAYGILCAALWSRAVVAAEHVPGEPAGRVRVPQQHDRRPS